MGNIFFQYTPKPHFESAVCLWLQAGRIHITYGSSVLLRTQNMVSEFLGQWIPLTTTTGNLKLFNNEILSILMFNEDAFFLFLK